MSEVKVPNTIPVTYSPIFSAISTVVTETVISTERPRNCKAAVGEALLPFIQGNHPICNDPQFLPAFLAYIGLAVYEMELQVAKETVRKIVPDISTLIDEISTIQ